MCQQTRQSQSDDEISFPPADGRMDAREFVCLGDRPCHIQVTFIAWICCLEENFSDSWLWREGRARPDSHHIIAQP